MPIVPSFLIVGAMKSGTTTLYHDLLSHPDVFLPAAKEPETLVRFETTEEMRQDYERLFRPCRPGQLGGEASTAYTKRPDYEGVAERALEVCGPDLRVIYIRRDPVERAISHYLHDKQHGLVSASFSDAVREQGRYVDYGRYDWQIAPWIAAFGRGQVMQIELATYSRDRQQTLARVLEFIGADPARAGTIDVGAASNSRREQKHMENATLRSFIYSDFYQGLLKPLIPRSLRERARRAILPPPADLELAADPVTERFIRDSIENSPRES